MNTYPARHDALSDLIKLALALLLLGALAYDWLQIREGITVAAGWALQSIVVPLAMAVGTMLQALVLWAFSLAGLPGQT